MSFPSILTRFSPSLKLPPFSRNLEAWSVWLFALCIAIATFIYSFWGERLPGYEDAGFFNPIYMFLHHGKMSYPAHLYFDAMVIHPPIHYLQIALLMKLGFGLMRAAAVLLFVPMMLNLWLIVRSPFSTAAKLGLMAGSFCAVLILSSIYIVRPEPHLALAWFAALLALESGRVEKWRLGKLALGGFLSAYIGGLHYWAIPAIAMPAVYAGWAMLNLGWRRSLRPIAALGVGTGLFVIPYALFFVLPNWSAIYGVLSGVQATGGVWESITAQLKMYSYVWQIVTYPVFAHHFTDTLLTPGLVAGIPLIVIALVIWGSVPGTRGIAIAGGILPLFVLLGVKRKASELYILPEIILYLSGVIMVSILLGIWLAHRFSNQRRQRFILMGLWVALAIAVFTQIPGFMQSQLRLTTADLTQSWQVARAAGQEIMGRNALIASSTTVTWYTSGSTYWYHVGADLGYPNFQKKDRRSFLAQFDSIPIEGGVWFVYDEKVLPIPDWYLDGELYWQGFFAHSQDVSFSLLFLSANRPSQVVGYGFWQNKLHRFQEQPDGDFVAATMVCRVEDTSKLWQPISPHARVSTFTYLDTPAQGGRFITSFVMERQQYEQERTQLTQNCSARDVVPGDFQPADENTLLERLDQEGQPVQFFQSLEQALKARNSL